MANIQSAISRAKDYAPYLAESCELYPKIVEQFQVQSPVDIYAKLTESLPDISESLDVEMSVLRQFKRQAHLLVALADLAAIWDWAAVTEHLTQLADICMDRLLVVAAKDAGIEGSDNNPVPGFFILAVGKYGARELNYSSDIDFNVFYDPDVVNLPNPARAERTLIKLVQSLIKGFERITPDGYIFRTDLRLRPDPRSNAVAVSTHTAERYYETLGQNWERAAMIKARVCGGDKEVGKSFIQTVLSPFIWRRNLDYAAIDDILAIKRQIHASASGTNIHVPGYHLKLGKGGIREIEFYAQVQQLILGGRQPDLRVMRTVEALERLSAGRFITQDDAVALTRHYADLRTFEHRAQMIADAQTHHVPEDDEERENFARLCGFEHRAELEIFIQNILQDVHERYMALFPEAETLSSHSGNLVFTGVEPGPDTLKTLEMLGFENGQKIWAQMANWLGGRIPATKTERARELFTSLAPRLLEACARTDNAGAAFQAFADFFTSLNQGVSILSMFFNEPERLEQIVHLMSHAPQISERLAETPAILDAMADPHFLNIESSTFANDYVSSLSAINDFELALNTIRRRVREDHFRITTAILLGHIKIEQASDYFTMIAEETVKSLLPVAIAEVERVAGLMRGEIAVLGMGKMGGREMRLTSDLDIMLIYEPEADQDSAQRYYTKVTQRLISALSSVTEEGGLFEVDMALRPSGRAGPVAVSVDAFSAYYTQKAWTWEFMALTRARIIASSSSAFSGQLEQRLKHAMLAKRDDLSFVPDISDMLRRTRAEKTPKSSWDIKNIKGGHRDAEYIVQSLYLKNRQAYTSQDCTDSLGMCKKAHALRQITDEEAESLNKAFRVYDGFSQYMSLTGRGSVDGSFAREIFADLLRQTGFECLDALLDETTTTVSQLTNKYIF